MLSFTKNIVGLNRSLNSEKLTHLQRRVKPLLTCYKSKNWIQNRLIVKRNSLCLPVLRLGWSCSSDESKRGALTPMFSDWLPSFKDGGHRLPRFGHKMLLSCALFGTGGCGKGRRQDIFHKRAQERVHQLFSAARGLKLDFLWLQWSEWKNFAGQWDLAPHC